MESVEETNKNIELKVNELLELTCKFIYPDYYSHTNKIMWKISNVYTNYKEEILVLCSVEEGIEKALDMAIEQTRKKRLNFYAE